ncbi:hypothetical protein ACFSUK_28880 [Sphingobium scionense]
MNAVAVIEAAPVPAPTLEQWLDISRAIADEGRRVGWAFADWARQGKVLGYTKQLGFNFLGHELGIDPRRLEIIDKAADAFPPEPDTQSLAWSITLMWLTSRKNVDLNS